ncbi:MAG: hypothetical protein M3024_04455 [Candidatus Dormibacteraeota bacterium]|nr:hypothetical protein [Candidatus Dormibacteraeota bacterium]
MRVFNRLLSLLVALALVAAGLWLLGLSIAHALAINYRPGWMHVVDQSLKQALHTLAGVQLADWRVLAAAAGLAVIGLVLLMLELKPRPPLVLLLDEDDIATWWLHRATFEQALGSSVVTETPATGARAWLRGRRRWRLKIDAYAPPEQRGAIVELVRSCLERLERADSTIQVRTRGAGRAA